MPGSRLLLGALAVLATLAACDSGGDPQPLETRPPRVDSLAFSPDTVSFDADAGDTLAVDLALSVTATDPDGEVARVQYAVEWQYDETVARGTLADEGSGRYAGTVPLQLSRGQRGRYTVLVYAVDDDGVLGNQVSGTLLVDGPGLGPPTLAEVGAPETFRPPGTLTISAVAADPDGPEDIARVEGTFPNSGVFQLRDDGSAAAGDAQENDGRYTVSFGIDAATPGPLPVQLWATDRDGVRSDTTRFTITIVE